MSLSTVLVPIDFSECSLNALKTALRLCKKSQASLIILHAIKDPVVFSSMQPEEYTRIFVKETEDKANLKFLEIENQLKELEEIDYEFKVSHDLVENAIAYYEHHETLDLVVMGTRGASGLKGLLFGSITYWVIKNVNCPVLAISEKAKTDDRFDKVVLAAEFRETAPKSTFDALIDIVELDQSELHVLHVSDSSILTSDKAEEAWTLESYFKDLDHSFHFKYDSHTEEGLANYLKENEIELLAVVAKKRNLLEKLFHISMTRKLAFHLSTPLLILHE